MNLSEKERDPVRRSDPRGGIILPDVDSVRRSSGGRHDVKRIHGAHSVVGFGGVNHGGDDVGHGDAGVRRGQIQLCPLVFKEVYGRAGTWHLGPPTCPYSPYLGEGKSGKCVCRILHRSALRAARTASAGSLAEGRGSTWCGVG